MRQCEDSVLQPLLIANQEEKLLRPYLPGLLTQEDLKSKENNHKTEAREGASSSN